MSSRARVPPYAGPAYEDHWALDPGCGANRSHTRCHPARPIVLGCILGCDRRQLPAGAVIGLRSEGCRFRSCRGRSAKALLLTVSRKQIDYSERGSPDHDCRRVPRTAAGEGRIRHMSGVRSGRLARPRRHDHVHGARWRDGSAWSRHSCSTRSGRAQLRAMRIHLPVRRALPADVVPGAPVGPRATGFAAPPETCRPGDMGGGPHCSEALRSRK